MPHVLHLPESTEFWVDYYNDLITQQDSHPTVEVVLQRGLGAGLPGFQAYKGYQRGAGLGSFFAGLFRRIFPVLKSVGKVVGKQALTTGASIAGDLVKGRAFKESLVEHGKAGATNALHEVVNQIAPATANPNPDGDVIAQPQQGKGIGRQPKKSRAQPAGGRKRGRPPKNQSVGAKKSKRTVGPRLDSGLWPEK